MCVKLPIALYVVLWYYNYRKKETRSKKMSKWEMLDKVIMKYGFEVEETIEFAYLCEKGTDKQIQETYENLMK